MGLRGADCFHRYLEGADPLTSDYDFQTREALRSADKCGGKFAQPEYWLRGALQRNRNNQSEKWWFSSLSRLFSRVVEKPCARERECSKFCVVAEGVVSKNRSLYFFVDTGNLQGKSRDLSPRNLALSGIPNRNRPLHANWSDFKTGNLIRRSRESTEKLQPIVT